VRLPNLKTTDHDRKWEIANFPLAFFSVKWQVSAMRTTVTLRPDTKGRVALGKLALGVSSFHATTDDKGRIILEPYTEIPASEKWLFDNKPALAAVKKGLSQAAAGRIKSLGSFARFANDEID
jgi:hypothetical protein